MELRHHKTLTSQKWRTYSSTQRILMVATELNRAGHWIHKEDFAEVRLCYERAMELMFLTVETAGSPRQLRELLRFVEVLNDSYMKETPDFVRNSALLKVLLLMDTGAWSAWQEP